MIREDRKGWRVELYDPKAKSKFRVRPRDYGMATPTSREEALELERLAKAEQERNPDRSIADGPMTVQRYADVFCSRQFNDFGHEILPQTNDHYRAQLKKFIERHGQHAMNQITVPQAKDFAREYRGTVREVKAMFASALRDEIIPADPFANVRVSQRKGDPKAFLKLNDVQSLIGAAKIVYPDWVDFHAFIAWLAGTGMRPGEGAGSQYEYFDTDHLRYDVQWQWHAKRRELVRPKHGSTGMVFVFDWAAEAVQKLPRHDSGFMFHNRSGTPMDGATISTAFNAIRHLAGVPKATAGALRHFHASYLLNELGLPVYTVAQQLRHSGTELIEQTYGHPDRAMHLDRIQVAAGRNMGTDHGGSLEL